MKKKLFDRHFYIVLGIDLVLLTLSILVAHLVRFEFDMSLNEWSLFFQILPLVLASKIAVFYLFDLYSGMWRYTSIADLTNIIKASSFGTLIVVFLILFSHNRFVGVPRSVFLIDLCFTILLVSGFRIFIRLYFEQGGERFSILRSLQVLSHFLLKGKKYNKNLLIIGAGDGGEKIFREIRSNSQLQFNVIGFLDDNPKKFDRKIHGVPVLGKIDELKSVVKNMGVDEVLIAIPSANSQQMRRIVDFCKNCGVDYKTIPGLGELINGRVTVQTIREVAYRDLLGRDVIKLDTQGIGAYLHNQFVMVTGAGGSIGSELCRQICRFQPKKIVLLDMAETPLYEIEIELKRNYGAKGIQVIPVLGDIKDKAFLEKTFNGHQPNVVFHAAAYKHVPMLELQPWKAIENNILGTNNLVEVVNQFKTERFVFVSTDKAVRPTNVMGASKRLAEMIIQGQNGCGRSNTRFLTVRFGNVVGSSGSVLPLFKKQISLGGPLTVTHPNVTRYFMTIPEACQLILQAGAMGNGGEIFILDMGTPIKIDDMARDLIRFSGFEPDVDIHIEYIGLRPGEKLHEELITEGEGIIPTSHEKILVLRCVDCNLDLIAKDIDNLAKLAAQRDIDSIKDRLHAAIPGYQPQ